MNIKPSSLIIHNPYGIRCFQTKFAFYLAEFDKREIQFFWAQLFEGR